MSNKKKENPNAGLGLEFNTNPYNKLSDLLYDHTKAIIIEVDDNFLKKAMGSFLESHNFHPKSDKHERHGYMYISLEFGFYNYIEEPNYEGKTVYELPFDWNDAIKQVENYVSETPIEKKEEVVKNPEGWNIPRS